MFYYDKNKKEVIISPYINLTAENLVTFSNINIEIMKKTFEQESYSEETCERYNLWMLELIKAYDKSKDKKWLDFAEYICDRIIKSSVNSIYKINKLQIIKRNRKLSMDEKDTLYKIRKDEEDCMVQCAVAILLDNKSDFERYFDMLNEEQRKNFIGFPIYNIYK